MDSSLGHLRLLSTYFSKNMIINLLSAVIVTNLSRVLMNNKEGLENKEKEDDGEKKILH